MTTESLRADIASPADIVAFWREAGRERWFTKDAAFDAQIAQRFGATWDAAARGELTAWETSDEGALALVIVLDQFPRNMFRGEARAFASDPPARDVAHRALVAGRDARTDTALRTFFYLPFEHSERREDQERSLALYRAHGDVDGLKWAELHADVIRRFGRFPHRNAALGRATTPDEQGFLDSGGFSG
jgi:uncharacterized protein (DUF924 family)